MVLTGVIAGVVLSNLRKAEPLPVVRFEHHLPEKQKLNVIFENVPLAVSPDGRQFVYGTPEGLFMRSMNELTAQAIAGTEGAMLPVFSPDGKWLAYFPQKIKN